MTKHPSTLQLSIKYEFRNYTTTTPISDLNGLVYFENAQCNKLILGYYWILMLDDLDPCRTIFIEQKCVSSLKILCGLIILFGSLFHNHKFYCLFACFCFTSFLKSYFAGSRHPKSNRSNTYKRPKILL